MAFKLFQQVQCKTADELINFGQSFVKHINPGNIYELDGDLGAGKTTFVKGIAKGLNIVEDVTSPTFNLMAMYYGNINLIHIDAYRMEYGERLDVLDFAQEPYVIFVEWANNLQEIADLISWKIKFTIDSNGFRNLIIYTRS